MGLENVLRGDDLVGKLSSFFPGLDPDYVRGFVSEVDAAEPTFEEFSYNRGRYEYAIDSFLRFGECQDVLLEGLLKYFFLRELSAKGVDVDLIRGVYDGAMDETLLRYVFPKVYGPSLLMECINYTFLEDKPSRDEFDNYLFRKYKIIDADERVTIKKLLERLYIVKDGQESRELGKKIRAGRKRIREILKNSKLKNSK